MKSRVGCRTLEVMYTQRDASRKDQRLDIRLSRSEKRQLDRAAKALGTTPSEYVRVWIAAGARMVGRE